LLLDGLDEVPHRFRQDCIAQILTLAEERPRCGIVVASRPYPSALLPFHKLLIAPLKYSDIVGSLIKQYGSIKQFRRHFDGASPADYVNFHMRQEVVRLCRMPLTLSMVITLLRSEKGLPTSLFGVYDRFVSWIFHWELKNERGASAVACQAAAEELAFLAKDEGGSTISQLEWTVAVGRVLQLLRERQMVTETDAETVTKSILSTGLVNSFEGDLAFSHKTFQDFFFTRRLLMDSAQLASGGNRPEVAVFVCGGIKNANRVLRSTI